MPLHATLVEINVYEGMVPLASGYLQSYAWRDDSLRREWRIGKLAHSRKATPADVLRDALTHDSALYAFSCYVWNTGHVKSIVPVLLEERPDATILLGGPQVMQHAGEYLDPAEERVIVCNGEGERTFAGVLRELGGGRPDFARVNGLSFHRDGELVTTTPEPRIQDLDEIPSPFLSGVFDGTFRMSVLETNRGCPFRCGFCYWGAANNDRVFSFDEARVRDEIDWLSRHEVPVLHIADANWGMLGRDIGLSQHIAECKAQRLFPMAVIFAAAKNSPRRVAEITRVFTDAGLVNTQPISMQSLDDTTLEHIDRENIKLGAYAELQQDLNDRGVGSYIELIWPLPGETLESFEHGIEELCGRGAGTIIVYAHLLLHNTPLSRDRERYGLGTQPAQDGAAEAHVVTRTSTVDNDDFVAGMWFLYAVKALHNTHHAHLLSSYLHRRGLMSYGALFTAFAAFCREHPDHPFTRFCADSIANVGHYEFTNYPTVYHMVLHGERERFGELFDRFAESQPWWSDEGARLLHAADRLAKPYIYSNTALAQPKGAPASLQVIDVDEARRTFVVEVSREHAALLRDHWQRGQIPVHADRACRLRIQHGKVPYPFNPAKSAEDRADYCSGMITRLPSVLPTWTLA